MWETPEKTRPRFGLGLWTMLGLVALIAAGFWAWRDYSSPQRGWRRAIRGVDLKARADAWTRVQRDRSIPGLGREGTTRELFALLDDPDPEIRVGALTSLPSIDPEPLLAIPRIAEKLGDRDPSVRAKATIALGELVKRGEPGRDEAIAAISRALKDADPTVRRAAVIAIGQVVYSSGPSADPLRSCQGDDPALSLVADRLRDDEAAVQVEAAYVLACNDRGGEAVPNLTSYVRSQPISEPPTYLADRAFLALTVLAIHSDEAAAFLNAEIASTREGYPDRPRDALAWAARQDPSARARVKRLATATLRSQGPTIRHNAAILLHEIGSGQSALAELIGALGDPSVDIRIRAIEALADLGDTDPTIVPALQAATSDPNPVVREHARGALEAIEWAELMSEATQ